VQAAGITTSSHYFIPSAVGARHSHASTQPLAANPIQSRYRLLLFAALVYACIDARHQSRFRQLLDTTNKWCRPRATNEHRQPSLWQSGSLAALAVLPVLPVLPGLPVLPFLPFLPALPPCPSSYSSLPLLDCSSSTSPWCICIFCNLHASPRSRSSRSRPCGDGKPRSLF